MNKINRYYTIELNRNKEYRAHIRESDYTVIFERTKRTGKSEHLFDEYAPTLLKNLAPVKKNLSKKTFTLYLVLTDRCNLHCTYCDVLSAHNCRNTGTDMSQEIAQTALDVLIQRLEKDPELFAQLVFFGGEPLLNYTLLVWICESIEKLECRGRIEKMLVTNGTLLNRERAIFLSLHQVYVVVSLDGRMEPNDKVRVDAQGKGSYSRVEKGIRALMEILPGKFGISCTLGSHNASSLADEISWMQDAFNPCCTGINIYHYCQDGSCPVELDDDNLADSLIEAFAKAREKGIAIYQFIGILKGFVNRQQNRDYCAACVDKLLFNPQGKVGRCETLMDDERFTVPVSYLKQNSDLPSYLNWTRYTPEYEPLCQDCFARWICPGSCAYDQLVTTGELHGVQERRCKFHRKLLVELLEIVLDAALAETMNREVLVPRQSHFNMVPGQIPMSFPNHTIWIVSLSNVVEK